MKHELGLSNSIPVLKDDELEIKIQSHQKTVVFFLNNSESIDFANFAMFRLNGTLSFVKSYSSISSNFDCNDFPCPVAFQNGRIVNTVKAPLAPVPFSTWCYELVINNNVHINTPEELRLLFNKHGSFVIGVDMKKRPTTMKDSEMFYIASSSCFVPFNLNVSAGIYVFRSADRQIVRVSGDYRKYTKTMIVDPVITNISSRPYVAGFFLEGNNVDMNSEEIQLLNKLAHKYSEKIHFVPFYGGFASILADAGRIGWLETPLFVVFQSNNLKGQRWAIQGQKAHNFEFLDLFIEEVLTGNNNNSVVSSQITQDSHPLAIETQGFFEKINNDGKDSIVLIVSKRFSQCNMYISLFEEANRILEGYKIQFYILNVSENDVPQTLSIPSKMPMLYLWLHGKDIELPIEFTGEVTIADIVEFSVEHSSFNNTAPEYDSDSIMARIAEQYIPNINDLLINDEL